MINIEEVATDSHDQPEAPLRFDSQLATRIRLASLADDEYRAQMFHEVIEALNDLTFTDSPIEVMITTESVTVRRQPWCDD